MKNYNVSWKVDTDPDNSEEDVSGSESSSEEEDLRIKDLNDDNCATDDDDMEYQDTGSPENSGHMDSSSEDTNNSISEVSTVSLSEEEEDGEAMKKKNEEANKRGQRAAEAEVDRKIPRPGVNHDDDDDDEDMDAMDDENNEMEENDEMEGNESSEPQPAEPEPPRPVVKLIRGKTYHVEVTPTSGYWIGGTFLFEVKMNAKNNERPPNVKCLSKVFHPNIAENDGKVALTMLRKPIRGAGEDDAAWKSSNTIDDVANGIQSMFTEVEEFAESLNVVAASLFAHNKVEFAKRASQNL